MKEVDEAMVSSPCSMKSRMDFADAVSFILLALARVLPSSLPSSSSSLLSSESKSPSMTFC